mmetsp:Transcript_107804/g.170221  ORF Transcript_107804/g.170221 Transcript_107804/m.170221 type:complete len:115 (-) Transcript_107804:1394-1738(-)
MMLQARSTQDQSIKRVMNDNLFEESAINDILGGKPRGMQARKIVTALLRRAIEALLVSQSQALSLHGLPMATYLGMSFSRADYQYRGLSNLAAAPFRSDTVSCIQVHCSLMSSC